MKKTVKGCIAILSLTAVTSLTYAANPGTYAGLGLGWGKQDTSANLNLPGAKNSTSDKTDKLAGRIFAGYNFNQNFGVEAGLAKYGDSKYKNASNLPYPGIPAGINVNQALNYKMSALDVVGKAYLPVADGFNVYGLGGLALVRSEVKYNVNASATVAGVPVTASKNYSKTQTKVRPVLGLGASYDIPQTKLTTNFEFSHIQGYGNVKTNRNAVPSANLVSLNLAYNFG